jgi:hypothetical protein
MQEVTRNSRAFPFKKYPFQKLQPSHSADAKLTDLTPPLTISIPLSACGLKSTVWRTDIVTTHTEKCHCTESIGRE